jgi:hypothetical protein
LPPDHGGTQKNVRFWLSAFPGRKLVLYAQPPGTTQVVERTGIASRSPRQADRRTEVHKRLVKFTGPALGQMPGCKIPQLLFPNPRVDCRLNAKYPCQDAADIAIERGLVLAKCNR